MKIGAYDNYDDYKRASDANNRTIRDQMDTILDAGIAAAGMRAAFEAALKTQHKQCAEFFQIITRTFHGCIERGIEEPMLPLTKEVIESFNNAAGSCQMVAELLKRGALDELSDK